MLRIQPRIAVFPLLLGLAAPLGAGEAPKFESLRVQKLDGTTYFAVKVTNIDDYFAPTYGSTRGWWTEQGRAMARTPRLVPQDDKTHAVYFLPAQNLFVGKVNGAGPAS